MKPLTLFFLFFCTCAVLSAAAFAESETDIDRSGHILNAPLAFEAEGLDTACISDGDYYTCSRFDKGELTLISEKPASAFYIVWNEPPAEYTVAVGDDEISIKDGFLHRLIKFDEPLEKIKIGCPEGGEICDIYLFSERSNLPDYVQDWREPCEQADLMVFSAHADDELLMFGGTLPYYAGELDLRVQAVYMTTHWEEQPRPHEMLDGLWTAGVENYPVLGIIPDIPYQPIFTLSEAAALYDFEEISEWFVEQIRRFKPSVIVTHDLKGEYGHAAHKLAAKTAAEAVELSYDPTVYPLSAEKYGVWDVPKLYLHFYAENTVEMDWEIPLESFGGITAREAAALCYDKHKSQHVWGYSVGYRENWDCRQFGLYRSLTGADTKADFMDNITPLSKEKPAEPEVSEAARETIEEQELQETEEKEETAAESSSQLPPKTDAEGTEIKTEKSGKTEAAAKNDYTAYFGLIIAAALIVPASVIIILAQRKRRKK